MSLSKICLKKKKKRKNDAKMNFLRINNKINNNLISWIENTSRNFVWSRLEKKTSNQIKVAWFKNERIKRSYFDSFIWRSSRRDSSST